MDPGGDHELRSRPRSGGNLTIEEMKQNKRASDFRRRAKKMAELERLEKLVHEQQKIVLSISDRNKKYLTSIQWIYGVEIVLAVINLILELSPATLERLSSHGIIDNDHAVALALMLMSFFSLLLCFADIGLKRLIHKKEKELWFPVSSISSQVRYNSFYIWFDGAGYASAFLQFLLTTINYFLVRGNSKIEIGITVMPLVFATAMIWPKIKEYRYRTMRQ